MGKAHFMCTKTRLQCQPLECRNLNSGFSRFDRKVSEGKVFSLRKKRKKKKEEKKITEPLPFLTVAHSNNIAKLDPSFERVSCIWC